jgi:hypothetical protein
LRYVHLLVGYTAQGRTKPRSTHARRVVADPDAWLKTISDDELLFLLHHDGNAILADCAIAASARSRRISVIHRGSASLQQLRQLGDVGGDGCRPSKPVESSHSENHAD